MNASTEASICDELLDLLKRVVRDISFGGEVSLATYSEILNTLKTYNVELKDGSHD